MSVTTATATRADLRSDGPADDSPDRWVAHPLLSWLLRFAVIALPVAAAVGASVVVESSVSRPHGWTQLWWWSATLVVSAVTATIVGRGVRRLTPLATLLRLTLLFPDQAPSRFKVARTAANPTRLAELADGSGERSIAAAQVLALMAQLSSHDRLTRGHSERVRVFADLIADELGVVGIDRDMLRWGALVHDIGKISVPAAVLNKKGRPDAEEWALIQGHPAAGEAYAGPLFEWLGPWAGAITEHHERWDGTGYPRRIGGNDLTLGGRIVAVADAYETMTAARSYKKPLSVEAARRELTVCAGHQFDPEIVRAFLLISVGRLTRALGPLAWLAQLPLAVHLQAAATRVTTATAAAGPTAALGIGGLAAVAATLSGAAPTQAATPPRHVVTAARPTTVGHAAATQTAHLQSRNSAVPAATESAPVGAIDTVLFAALHAEPVVTPDPATAGQPAVGAPAVGAPATPPPATDAAPAPTPTSVAVTVQGAAPPPAVADTPSAVAASPGVSGSAPPVPTAATPSPAHPETAAPSSPATTPPASSPPTSPTPQSTPAATAASTPASASPAPTATHASPMPEPTHRHDGGGRGHDT